MRFPIYLLALIVSVANAAPDLKPSSHKRYLKRTEGAESTENRRYVPIYLDDITSNSRVLTEVCNVGFATQNSGTFGGVQGQVTEVTTLTQLREAAKVGGPAIVVIRGTISGAEVVTFGSDTSIIGAQGSVIDGVGLRVNGAKNVIFRNLKISKVAKEDALSIQASTNVWIDHCDLSSESTGDKDAYDGALNINHGSDFITVSNTFIHDHHKTSLIGHSDENAAEDGGKLHITFANMYFDRCSSRQPSIRFGVGHIFNTYIKSVGISGINTRMGAEVLVESSVFENTTKLAIFSADSAEKGHAVVRDVDLGGGENTAPEGNLKSVPYEYTLLGSGNVKEAITKTAGQTLTF